MKVTRSERKILEKGPVHGGKKEGPSFLPFYFSFRASRSISRTPLSRSLKQADNNWLVMWRPGILQILIVTFRVSFVDLNVNVKTQFLSLFYSFYIFFPFLSWQAHLENCEGLLTACPNNCGIKIAIEKVMLVKSFSVS